MLIWELDADRSKVFFNLLLERPILIALLRQYHERFISSDLIQAIVGRQQQRGGRVRAIRVTRAGSMIFYNRTQQSVIKYSRNSRLRFNYVLDLRVLLNEMKRLKFYLRPRKYTACSYSTIKFIFLSFLNRNLR